MPPNIVSIRQIKIPVSDLQRSVDWYCALLGLQLSREFVEEDELAGAVLSHPAGFVISVRLRSRVPGNPHFPGFDLFSLGVESVTDLAELSARAQSLGSTHGDIVDRGPDGQHLDVYDPDGTAIRFLTPRDSDAPAFVGVAFDSHGVPEFYEVPRARLP
jgi:catechol 2,3-dioxygenase-like lactoylglutathione lyase family enzyme